jgi:hypothetical protein
MGELLAYVSACKHHEQASTCTPIVDHLILASRPA